MKKSGKAGIAAAVQLRLFFSAMIALAMFVAPLAMPTRSAQAAPANHADMAQAHDCGDQKMPEQPNSRGDKSCCLAMCGAINADLPASLDAPAYGRIAQRLTADPFHRGHIAEIATPPPRTS